MTWLILLCLLTGLCSINQTVCNLDVVTSCLPAILALSIRDHVIAYSPSGSPIIKAENEMTVSIIGSKINEMIGGIFLVGNNGSTCNNNTSIRFNRSSIKNVSEWELEIHGLIFEILDENCYYIMCVQYTNASSVVCLEEDSKFRIYVKQDVREYLLPLPFQISWILVLACFSGLFSGLNLGLMALNPEELEIVQKAAKETRIKNYAKTILPVRRQGNYLLCSLLLGNVICNTAISILFGNITESLLAILCSTMLIVLFGEILPQSVCQRYNLAVGAKTIYITILLMIITFPVSWPIAKVLDFILKKEGTRSYNRERLCQLIKTEIVHDLQKPHLSHNQELQLLQGALEFSCKTVKSIMTNINDVFMLEASEPLTTEKLRQIVLAGYSRIPVYKTNPDNISYILNVKDLTLLDHNDNIPVHKAARVWSRPVKFVDENTELNSILADFQTGNCHMFIVQRDGSVTGIVTLEDVIEEILGSEILDETDRIRDTKSNVILDTEIQKKSAKIVLDKIFESLEQLHDPRITYRISISSTVSDMKSIPSSDTLSMADDEDMPVFSY